MKRPNPEARPFPLAREDGPPLWLGRELFRSASRMLHRRIADRYDVDIPVRLATTGYSHFEEAIGRLGREEGGVFMTFNCRPGDLQGIVFIEGPLLYRITGLLMGEDPEAEAPLYRSRVPTEVDLAVARRLAQDTLSSVEATTTTEPKPRFERLADGSGARLRSSFPGASTVIEVSIDFGPPDQPYGLLTVILPVRMASVLWSLEATTHHRRGGQELNRVMQVPVQVTAELARLNLTLAELRALEPGHVLELGTTRDVRLRIGDRTALVGEAGERESTRCIRVKRKVMDFATEPV